MKEDLPDFLEKVISRYPRVWENYGLLGQAVSSAGGLDARSQKLVKLGIAIGAGRQGAVHSHTRKCRPSRRRDLRSQSPIGRTSTQRSRSPDTRTIDRGRKDSRASRSGSRDSHAEKPLQFSGSRFDSMTTGCEQKIKEQPNKGYSDLKFGSRRTRASIIKDQARFDGVAQRINTACTCLVCVPSTCILH